MHTDLPSPVELQLLALTITERSGREVAKLYEDETRRSMSWGTLYTTLRRMAESKWVTVRDGADEDGRIRYFKITGKGATALERAREHHRGLAGFGLARREADGVSGT
ncbi:MAG: PadR family transcriptional regulator [Planctomycetes bacterium]|nr:PadR family transcriptional regulator [Planctomycetota bacterium]